MKQVANLLFECTLVVKDGIRTKVVFYYVADSGFTLALIKAKKHIENLSYTFEEVWEKKVAQIDTNTCWEALVIDKWKEFSLRIFLIKIT